MILMDMQGCRALEIDGDNRKNPGSVFIVGPYGFCMELNKFEFIESIMHDFNLAPARSISRALAA